VTTRIESPAFADQKSQSADSGLWLFILLDLVIFSLFFGTALFYRATDPTMYEHGQAHLSTMTAFLNTLVLVAGSLVVVRAVQSARVGQFRQTRVYAALGALCGGLFILVKVHEYLTLFGAGYTPQTDEFFMSYFCFTMVHLAHVIIATVALLWIVRTALRRPKARWVANTANYWHMVDLLWLMLFPVLYLA
jgi:nitric oxide reductase NorE protein